MKSGEVALGTISGTPVRGGKYNGEEIGREFIRGQERNFQKKMFQQCHVPRKC